ncbi:MAG: hypothetical protein AB8G99_25455, partial [Planctomycetaceae bacterium]
MNEPSETSSDSSHVIREFENAWRSELVTDFGKSVPKQAHTDTDLLLELACIDLENRLRVSDDTRVEFYTTLFPQLAADELVVLELIRTEFANRPDRDSLNAAYYCERFPNLAAQIEMMFQLEFNGSGDSYTRD